MRKRSAYRPRMVMTDPLCLLRPAGKEQKAAVMLRFLTALEVMARGEKPTENEWRDLSDAINTVETLALTLRKLNSEEVMPVVNASIAAMVGAADRYKAGKSMRLDAAGLQSLRDVVAIYGQCLDELTEREMAQAQAETQRRVNQLLRARHSTHEVVCI